MLRRLVALMIALTLTGASAAAVAVATSEPPANVLHVRGGSVGDCTAQFPCGSIDEAVRRAGSGDQIWLYESQLLNQQVPFRRDAPFRTSNAVVMPAPGQNPVLTGIANVYAPRLTWRNIKIVNGSIKFFEGADHNRLEDSVIEGNVAVRGADEVTVIDSRIVGQPDWDTLNVGYGSRNTLIEGNVIGGARNGSLGGAAHVDCLQVFHGFTNLVIRGNTFYGCALSAMMLKSDFAPIDGLLIERNFIQDCFVASPACSAPHAIQLIEGTADGSTLQQLGTGLPMTNVVIRHNTIDGGIYLRTGHPVTIAGNILQSGLSGAGLYSDVADCTGHTIESNLVDRLNNCRIDETNLIGTATFADPAKQDLHLLPGSPGIDVGSAHASALDIDGDAVCGAVDLGADEVCSTTPTTTVPPSPPRDPEAVGEWSFEWAQGWAVSGDAEVRDGAVRITGPADVRLTDAAVAETLRSGQFSVEAWVEPAASTAPAPGAIFAAGVAGAEPGVLVSQGYWSNQTADLLQGRLYPTGGTVQLVDRRRAMPVKPTHVVLTRRASDGLTVLLVDGAVATSGRVAGSMRNLTGLVELTLGAFADGAKPWAGAVHHLRVLPRPLTSAEVASRYGAGVPRPPGTSTTTTTAPSTTTTTLPPSGGSTTTTTVPSGGGGGDPEAVGEWSFGWAEGWAISGDAEVRDGAVRMSGPADVRLESVPVADALRSGHFSVEGWVEPAASVAPAPGAIFSAGLAGAEPGFLLSQGYWANQKADLLQARMLPSGGTVSVVDRRRAMLVRPTHVVLTRRASDGLTVLFVDGQTAASARVAGSMKNLSGLIDLTLGSTADGTKPWKGAIHHLRVLPRPLAVGEVSERFARGLPADGAQPVPDGLVAHWNFDGGSGTRIQDLSRRGLDLEVAPGSDVEWAGDGLELRGPSRLASVIPASSIADAVAQSGAFTLVVDVTPAAAAQAGPARIVTMSLDALRRNVTVGQGAPTGESAAQWDFRLRTSATDDNGLPSLTTPAGTATMERTRIVYTRAADGTVVVYLNGIEALRGTAAGDLTGWDRSFGFYVGDEASGGRPWLGTVHEIAVWDRVMGPTA